MKTSLCHRLIRFMLGTAAGLLLPPVPGAFAGEAEWRPLFNGRDLAGWDTFLARADPSMSVPGETRGAEGKYLKPIGLNRDPLGVFSVRQVDGGPVLHFSGQVFGTLTTREEFANYHLRLQFKWGEGKWAPRQDAKRDSGLLYHVHGELGAGGATWPSSLEYQIQEGDCGDLYIVRTQVSARARVRGDGQRPIYDPTGGPIVFGAKQPHGGRCVHLGDHERPGGEWNTVELYCFGGEVVHVLNGKVVLRLSDPRKQGPAGWLPLTSGRISLQTEGAEIFFRNIEIRTIGALPAAW